MGGMQNLLTPFWQRLQQEEVELDESPKPPQEQERGGCILQ